MNNLGGNKKDIHIPKVLFPTYPNATINMVVIVTNPVPVPTDIIKIFGVVLLLDSSFKQPNKRDIYYCQRSFDEHKPASAFYLDL